LGALTHFVEANLDRKLAELACRHLQAQLWKTRFHNVARSAPYDRLLEEAFWGSLRSETTLDSAIYVSSG